jgi:hypothetical protein
MVAISAQAVSVREEQRVIPTYPTLAREPNPMFYETRNVQESRGNIYPYPMIDQISSQKVDCAYQAVVLENEFTYLVMLPELGGADLHRSGQNHWLRFLLPPSGD